MRRWRRPSARTGGPRPLCGARSRFARSAAGGQCGGRLRREYARVREGRLELLWYVREQSISTDYHRYGNLGIRADEARAQVN